VTGAGAAATPRWLAWTAAIATIVSAAAFVADNLLHAKELAHGHAARQLAIIAEHPDRWLFAHALGFVTVAAGGVFIVAMTVIVARDRPGAAVIGGACAVAGLSANAFLLAIDGYTWGRLGAVAARPGTDAPTLAAALTAVQESSWLSGYQALPALLAAGLGILTLAALRSGALTRTAVTAYLASVALLGLESVVHSNAFFIFTAVAYFAGGALLALALLGEPARRQAAAG
jgi:hypothetical protein